MSHFKLFRAVHLFFPSGVYQCSPTIKQDRTVPYNAVHLANTVLPWAPLQKNKTKQINKQTNKIPKHHRLVADNNRNLFFTVLETKVQD